MREFDANITYQSNCHYQESNANVNISLPLKKPTIIFSKIENVTNPTPNANNEIPNYFNDVLQFTILAKDGNNTIKWGNVIFYYIDDADVNQVEQQLNTDPIPIDINGNASIRFVPHYDGKIVAKYSGSPYFEDERIEEHFVLSKRPTYIEFTDFAPYLVNPKETIEMKVSVVDELTNEPLDYGLVTFLNYHTHDISLSEDGYEKVIGNPVYLIDGKAKIKYSPIQLKTNDLLNNIELIRASYNYDNTEYGVQWKYYLQNDDYTNIAIKRDNSVSIAKPYIANGDSDYTKLICTDGGLFEATENDNILLRATVSVTEDVTITNAKMFFVINGTEDVYEDDEVIKRKYNNVIEGAYNSQLECYEVVTKIPKGTYTICAEVQNPMGKFKNENYEQPSSPINIIDNISTHNESPILDSLYIQSNQSESFYIKINPEMSNINIEIYTEKETIFNGILSKNDIYGKITNAISEDFLILNNKKCYFWIPNLNKKYTGTITKVNDELKIEPDTDIQLIDPTDYLIYIYLPNGIYSSGGKAKKYKTIYSSGLTIKSRIEPTITLRKNSITNTYPGNIQYIISGENLASDIIDINIYLDNVFVTTHHITQLQPTIVDTIPEASVGSHILKATVTNNGYSISKQFSFNIDAASLVFELNSMSKYVNTGLQTDIIIGVKNEKNLNINKIDTTKLTAQLKYNNQTQNATITIDEINSNYFLITATGVIYSAGSWEIIMDYRNDNNYSNNNTILNFEAKNINPYCVNLECNNDYIKNRIVYSQTTDTIKEIVDGKERFTDVVKYDSINQNILIKSKLIKDENNSITFVHITNKIGTEDGHYTINRPNNITPSEWVQYTTLEYEIIPENTIFNDTHNNTTAVQAFNTAFSNNNCTTEQILLLYNQAKIAQYNNLFIGYNHIKDTINLWGEDDGTS